MENGPYRSSPPVTSYINDVGFESSVNEHKVHLVYCSSLISIKLGKVVLLIVILLDVAKLMSLGKLLSFISCVL